jgi:hypothetical protein
MATFKLGSKSRAKGKSIQVAKDIRITTEQHDKLVKHITDRLDISDLLREQQIERFAAIDRDLYGYLVLDFEDRERMKDNRKGHGIKPVDVKLSLVWAQLDEALTFLLTVLAPDEAIYNAVAPKEHQDAAKGFAALMNKHAEVFDHYGNLAKFVFNCLRYNFGAFGVEWKEVIGQMLVQSAETVAATFQRGIVEDGNAVISFDPYNLLYDPTVAPIEVPEKGEYFATIHMDAPFRFRKMEADGEVFGVDRFIEGNGQTHYYEKKPTIRMDVSLPEAVTDWIQILSLGEQTQGISAGFERIKYTGWINPKEFGLTNDDELQVWRVHLIDKKHIVNVTQMNNAHGMLPINIAMPIDDDFNWATKTYAEHLIPYQSFASHQVNVHQRASRKRLYGLTIYNDRVIPLMDQDDIDLAGGKIPATGTAAGQETDLRKAIVQFTDGPDTSRTMEDVERMDGLMQKIMPTDILKQVANLERAIYQFQRSVEILGPDGTIIEVNPNQFRNARIELTISDGLKGLDRLSLIMSIKEVLNSILQSQEASNRFDVVALINYWTSLLGDNTDFKQFEAVHPIDRLSPQEKDAAMQLLQQASQGGPPQGA